jgi:uncharacterized protein (DUF433 family)
MEPTASQTQPPIPEAKPDAAASSLPVISEHIGIQPGYCGGKAHILGHRIKVKHVALWHERMGMSPAQIVETYPTITLAQVHAPSPTTTTTTETRSRRSLPRRKRRSRN